LLLHRLSERETETEKERKLVSLLLFCAVLKENSTGKYGEAGALQHFEELEGNKHFLLFLPLVVYFLLLFLF
jgi:hypothetical protein